MSSDGTITLRGSATIITEFFSFAISQILFQRGIYDPESFTVVKKWGLPLQVTTDVELLDYLRPVLQQLEKLLSIGQVRKLVLVLTDLETQEVVERSE